jgi:hypothetical protein
MRELELDLIKQGEAAALIVLLLIALACVVYGGVCLHKFRRGSDGELTFRRHWGGFGGDSSGWRLSAPFIVAGMGLLLITAGISLASSTLYVLHAHTLEKPRVKGAAADTAGGKEQPDKAPSAAPPDSKDGDSKNGKEEEEGPAEELRGES